MTLRSRIGNILSRLLLWPIGLALMPVVILAAVAARFRRTRALVWGPVPIINNKYWSNAVRGLGFESHTFMAGYFGTINQHRDFDRYLGEVSLPVWPRTLRNAVAPYVCFMGALWCYRVFHIPFSGFLLGDTPFWRLEPWMIRLAGRSTVILPFGGDCYRYSRIRDPCQQHGLLMSYPTPARYERDIGRRVEMWTRHADAVVGCFVLDGIGRWDVLPFNHLVIDDALWRDSGRRSMADGINDEVIVVHTPNHRGVKGTEFLLAAIGLLKREGLRVRLKLIERTQNEEVRRIFAEEADILAEQFVLCGYGMSGIEGMASGLPVLANLEDPTYTRVFRRYSYLDECPVLSTTPETLAANLRRLVRDPALRHRLGIAGRQYVENFHSYATARMMFGSIYRRLLDGEQNELLNLFHPLLSDWRQTLPKVDHPLVESRLQRDAEA